MEKFASDQQVSSQDAIKCFTAGFASGIGSPASPLDPGTVNGLTGELRKRASERVERHEKLKATVLEHASA